MIDQYAHDRVTDALKAGAADAEWLRNNPDALAPYQGQWVMVHRGRIVAHAADGRVLVAQVADDFYGATVLYVPTAEEAGAVNIL